MRIQEMRQSTRILQQALKTIPEGDIRAKLQMVLMPPIGEACARLKGLKRRDRLLLASDGTAKPYLRLPTTSWPTRWRSWVPLTSLWARSTGEQIE